jgi:hypothetical protein
VKSTPIEQIIQNETERRLAEMQRPAYEFPPKATAADAWGIVLLVIASVVLIVLCMLGVIE